MARYNSATFESSYPASSNESTGGTSYPAINLVNDAPFQTNPNSIFQPGDVIVDKLGFQYVYVRANAGLAVGQCLRYAPNLTGTITSASSTVASITTNITTTIDESAVGSFLCSNGLASGTGPVFTKKIKKQTAIGANTNFKISLKQIFFGINQFDGDVLAASPALVNGDVVHVIRAYSVDVAGVADPCYGIAMGTVTSGNFTFVQTTGLARVSVIGSTDAAVENRYLCTAASGNAKGVLGTPTAASDSTEVPSIVGFAKMPYTGAAALMPVALANLADKW